MYMQPLALTIAQRPIVWDDPAANLRQMALDSAEAARHGSQFIVFPEVMLTGFDLNMDRSSLPWQGEVMQEIRAIAARTGVAIASSVFAEVEGAYRNRAYLATPEGEIFYQDKRHLFSMAGETQALTPGRERRIIEYRGWRIMLLTCYDLRFPVWCRNDHLEYDLLVVVANWPKPRVAAWSSLLVARAIENLSYAVGVNRVGVDPHGIEYSGESTVYSYMGRTVASTTAGESMLVHATLSGEEQEAFRNKFPVWRDADHYSLQI